MPAFETAPPSTPSIRIVAVEVDTCASGQACHQLPGRPSAHHFVTHVAAAANLYRTGHFFLRPSLDVQHVSDFYRFGSNWVPGYSLSFGYSVGKE